MYKVQNNCPPEKMNKVFSRNESIYEHDLTNTSIFAARRLKSVRYGSKFLPYLGPRVLKGATRRERVDINWHFIVHMLVATI